MTGFAGADQQKIILGVAGAVATVLTLAAFYLTPAGRSRMWTIIVTPLASIIGSGFLVVAPLLYSNFGGASLPAIVLINVFALAVGLVIRTNIHHSRPAG